MSTSDTSLTPDTIANLRTMIETFLDGFPRDGAQRDLPAIVAKHFGLSVQAATALLDVIALEEAPRERVSDPAESMIGFGELVPVEID